MSPRALALFAATSLVLGGCGSGAAPPAPAPTAAVTPPRPPVAPKAIRTPNSRARRLTAYIVTPSKPAAPSRTLSNVSIPPTAAAISSPLRAERRWSARVSKPLGS